MGIDERAEPAEAVPEGKKTVNLPAMTDRALLEDLRGVVKEGFRNLSANLEVVSNDLGVVKDRVTILETERGKYSGGFRGLSTADAEQAAQLAQERAAREALAAEVALVKADVTSTKAETTEQTVMLRKITGLMDTPMARRLGYAVGALLLAALTTATGYFARGNVATPTPTVIQLAAPPAVQVPK
jgi:hypothetical protein